MREWKPFVWYLEAPKWDLVSGVLARLEMEMDAFCASAIRRPDESASGALRERLRMMTVDHCAMRADYIAALPCLTQTAAEYSDEIHGVARGALRLPDEGRAVAGDIARMISERCRERQDEALPFVLPVIVWSHESDSPKFQRQLRRVEHVFGATVRVERAE